MSEIRTKDKNGNLLKVGDRVGIEAIVRDITTLNATNLTLETVEPVYGNQKTTLSLASSQVIGIEPRKAAAAQPEQQQEQQPVPEATAAQPAATPPAVPSARAPAAPPTNPS